MCGEGLVFCFGLDSRFIEKAIQGFVMLGKAGARLLSLHPQ